MGLHTKPLVTTPENDVSLSLECKELILLLKEIWGKKGLLIKSWSSNLICDPTTPSAGRKEYPQPELPRTLWIQISNLF